MHRAGASLQLPSPTHTIVPSKMASTLFEEDVVSRYHRGRLQLGLVVRNHDWYSSVDESEDEEEKIRKGHVRVAWYPRGRENVLCEKKVRLTSQVR